MPFTFEDRLRDTSPQGKANADRQGLKIPAAILDALAPTARETALQFDDLLGSAPADLARISDEIRSHPGLERLITRFFASLVISPGDTFRSIEEATIVLGTDRLRILVSIWLLFQKTGAEEVAVVESKITAPRARTNATPDAPESTWTPEMRYLASLMRLLGLNLASSAATSPDGSLLDSQFQKEQVQGLIELFGADFISLISSPNSAVLGSVRRLIPVKGAEARVKEPA